MKKRHLLLFALPLLTPCATAQTVTDIDEAFARSREIADNIRRPEIPERTFRITDYGARPRTPDAPCHEAINRAITECALAGGGRVVVPADTFYTGPLTLKSRVELHLETGAVLRFSTDPRLYYPAVLTRWEGIDCYNAHPLIYAYGETDVAVTGRGVIDGQGSKETWWPMCGAVHYGWREGMISQKNGSRERLLMYSETGTPVSLRQMTADDGLRPQLLHLYACRRVLVEDVTLLNSPFWVIHPLFCQDLTVRGVHVFNRGPNGDGCDPESCRDVLIEKCTFDTGDDCIAIKSGRNRDGRRWNRPSENIVVRDCLMKNGHGGVVIGSEISGGYRNLYVENCRMDSPELERVIRIKTSTCRGGTIENIFVRDVTVGRCREAVLRINLQYENNEPCRRGHIPTVRNVRLRNVTSRESRFGVYITGLREEEAARAGTQVYGVSLENCRFDNVAEGRNSIEGARDVSFREVYINGDKVRRE